MCLLTISDATFVPEATFRLAVFIKAKLTQTPFFHFLHAFLPTKLNKIITVSCTVVSTITNAAWNSTPLFQFALF